jgi:hypothetical protein
MIPIKPAGSLTVKISSAAKPQGNLSRHEVMLNQRGKAEERFGGDSENTYISTEEAAGVTKRGALFSFGLAGFCGVATAAFVLTGAPLIIPVMYGGLTAFSLVTGSAFCWKGKQLGKNSK